MAKLMVIGGVAQVEILTDPEDEDLTLARCVDHGGVKTPRGLHWSERFDTTDDAWQAAEQHADGVR